jgi:transposase-like protein
MEAGRKGRKAQKKRPKTGRQIHDPEVRSACMAALLAGQGTTAVAEQYNLPLATVSRWRKEARHLAGKSDDIGALVRDYLRANLTALKAQAAVFSDPTWLKQQGASEAGVLHGIMMDKAIRLLDAMEPEDPA